ncbi:MAG: protein kinase [Myxococcales bacterium]|nr:protein kinase [Myxococcales bacterium]
MHLAGARKTRFGQDGPALLQNDSLVLDGRFRVLKPLGGGGMGEVYLAEQVSLGRKVALKVLRQDLSLQPGMSERFRREARLLSTVDHPSVVRVIDFGQSGEASCLVMELVEGDTLQAVLRAGPLSPERGLPLFAQLAEGLAAIHDKGIVHRDLKPENVVITRGPKGEQARLLDFGIARLAEPDTPEGTVTQAGLVLGTPEYLSPEQALGTPLDFRSDLYSFGVLAFRALAGELPFAGPSPRQFLAQHVGAPPRRLEEASPALALRPGLCALVTRCLEKDPSARPPSAQTIAGELSRLTKETPPGPVPSSGTASFGAPVEKPRRTASSAQQGPVSLVTGSGLAVGRPKNLTLMLTDIRGFTERTSRQTREENARMLEEHDRLLLPLVRARSGRLVQKRGDALLVMFGSPTEAVRCGMGIQDRLWRHNGQVPPDQHLHVRVAIHLGEVLVERHGLVGEPVQVVAAVEEITMADEVVFTEAVRLAMSRAEVDFEDTGAVVVPGREEMLKLYRCRRRNEGAPFGGCDHVPASSQLLWLLQSALHQLWERKRAVARWGLPALALAGGIWALTHESAEARIHRLLEEHRPDLALSELDALSREGEESEEAKLLRAAALHAQDRHGEEHDAYRAAGSEALGEADALVVSGLAEDFGRRDDAASKKLLDLCPREVLSRLAESGATPAGWGALRYLDSSGGKEVDLVAGYVAALRSEDCHTRSQAARRLGELGDEDALEPLRAAADAPRKTLFGLIEQDCGHGAARAALRALERKQR